MSLGVIACYTDRVPRWQPDARARLQEAALTLYDEQGFDKTTVEEIAERAGLTKRTFFRHFADKREVLFGGGDNVEELVVTAIRAAPASVRPLDAVALGLDALAVMLDEQGEPAARRIRVVRATPELLERQLIKFASLVEAIARELRARGVGDPAAILAAESGITALRVASDGWVVNTKKERIRPLVVKTLAELETVASPAKRSGSA
jgi:AcrR family transcriptional regulator